MTKRIHIVAGIIVDAVGRTLLVRKRGTRAFMQPGGKLAEGEALLDALRREIQEELGCDLDQESVAYVGRFEAPAANEADTIVDAEIFQCLLSGEPRAQSEIAELLWFEPGALRRDVEFAPLTARHVLPRVRAP